MRKFLLLLPLLTLWGCHSHHYYQENAVEAARKYIFENARELTPGQYGFIRYTAPVLLTGDILGRNSENKVLNSLKGNERMQICIAWQIPELETVYMVYGVSGSMMRDWYPARLLRRKINTLDKKAFGAMESARSYAVSSLQGDLTAAELNKIRFSHPEMVQTSFQLGDNRLDLIKGANSSGDMVVPMPWQKALPKKVEKDEDEAPLDEEKIQISLVWNLENGRKAVFSGMGKEDLAGWAIEMGGIIKDDEFKSVFVKGLRTKAEFLIAPPEKEDDEKSKGGK